MTVSLTEPTTVSEMVVYQEGTIVRHSLLKNPGGNVTLFAFAAGQSLSEHTTPHEALAHVIEGEGVFYLDGRQHKVRRGQLLHLPANVSHAVVAEESFKMILTMIKKPNA